VLEQKFAFTLSAPVLPQIATAEYLSSGGYDHHLRRIRRIFAENIDRMLRIIELAFPKGTKVTRPSGGYVLWLQLPALVRTEKLFELAVKNGICFAPGRVFSTSGRYHNCLRLSCGFKWTAEIEKAVWKLGELAISLVEASRAMNRRGTVSASH
jgi:DNA-binding transcriptional MocR family regulator